MMLLGSKRDMANLLNEEVEERESMRQKQKMQQVQKMQKKKGSGSWER